MRFRCVAFDSSGQRVEELVEAESAAEATEQLRQRGLYVAQATAVRSRGGQHASAEAGERGRLRLGRSHRQLALFARQLSVLVSTGTPLVDALGSLRTQMRDPVWREAVQDVYRRVEEGSTLAEAMEHHPRLFDPVCRSLVAAGEAGGNLDRLLDRLSTLARQQQHVRSSVIGAMIYPLLLIVVAVAVLLLMIGFVLPRFAGLFETLDVPLPPTTELLVALSGLMRAYWWLVVALVAGMATGAWWWLGTPKGRRAWHALLLRTPQLGRVCRSFATARLLRLLGVLLDGHVPLLDALEMTRRACSNVLYAEMVGRAQDAVTRGEAVSSAFGDSRLIDPAICEAIRNGERSGRLADVMLSVASYLDEENDVVLRSLVSLIEPLILVLLGLLVGSVALSMFLPLFDLTSMTYGGGT